MPGETSDPSDGFRRVTLGTDVHVGTVIRHPRVRPVADGRAASASARLVVSNLSTPGAITMPRIQSFVRTRDDARAVLAAHRSHGSTPHFGCPHCMRRGLRVNRAR
jgi:hypothetical protein